MEQDNNNGADKRNEVGNDDATVWIVVLTARGAVMTTPRRYDVVENTTVLRAVFAMHALGEPADMPPRTVICIHPRDRKSHLVYVMRKTGGAIPAMLPMAVAIEALTTSDVVAFYQVSKRMIVTRAPLNPSTESVMGSLVCHIGSALVVPDDATIVLIDPARPE